MAAKDVIREIGFCVYCGATEGELTEEHIIPYALGANATIARASCSTCQEKTSAIEREVCRPIAGMARIRTGIQTRRPGKRVAIPKQVQIDGVWRRPSFPPDEFPATLCYPVFDKPGIVASRPPQGHYNQIGFCALALDKNMHELAARAKSAHGASSIKLAEFRPAVLMNFVAKVAQAAAYALLPAECFQPLLGKAATSEGVFDDLLGGGGAFPIQDDVLHAVEIRQTDGNAGPLIFARVRWFANLSAIPLDGSSAPSTLSPPSFLAIVGRPRTDYLKNKVALLNIATNGATWHQVIELPHG
jgi:hypothetical protein